jgi:hypothetical protein
MRVTYPQLIFFIKYAIISPGGQAMISESVALGAILLLVVAAVLAVAFRGASRKAALNPRYLESLKEDQRRIDAQMAPP